MASLITKKKGKQLYYYVVESARVEGKPRIVRQAYLGSAEKVAALVKDRTSPVPLSAASRDFGLPGALWLAAEQTGLFGLLEQLWPAPRSGPSPARYLLLAAFHRICQPGPKTEVADWYSQTILHSLWGIPAERFTSQAFWDAFEKILPEHLDPLATGDDDPLDRAQLLVHGQEYLCVLKYSASFAGEQLHSLTTSLSKVLQALRRFSMELNKPQARWKENQIRSKIQRWLSGQFLEELIRYQLESRDGRWHLQFDLDTAAWQRLVDHRLGRTVLLTNRMDWTAEQVAIGYSGQQEVERVFRGLKDGDWLRWGPMYHWTDRKIRIHAFYCMLGISLLQYLHKQAQSAWDGISLEQLMEELRQIQQFFLLYPPQGEKGPKRVATVLSKQTLTQQALAKTLRLDQLHITQRG